MGESKHVYHYPYAAAAPGPFYGPRPRPQIVAPPQYAYPPPRYEPSFLEACLAVLCCCCLLDQCCCDPFFFAW